MNLNYDKDKLTRPCTKDKTKVVYIYQRKVSSPAHVAKGREWLKYWANEGVHEIMTKSKPPVRRLFN